MNQLTQTQPSANTDFQKALLFYVKTLEIFDKDYSRLTQIFPQKYIDARAFLQQFQELDEVERLTWIDYHLKQAYIGYNHKATQLEARKNILWSLKLCKKFKIKLARQYFLMKMIKTLWIHDLPTKREDVTDRMTKLFAQLGQSEERKPLPNHSKRSKKPKSTVGCLGCTGGCLIF